MNLSFDNSFLHELPADPEAGNFRRQVTGAAYSLVEPTPVRAPRIVGWSTEVAESLGLPTEPEADGLWAQVFGGNRTVDGMVPWAARYGGHQFGNWAGQLGDGRAISLGELIAPDDRRWELQLKGAGPTPYSRSGDGRAVLRSSIREFLCSEAMHHLGVPTTRALSLVTTGEDVLRDMFYDGNPKPEPGAIVCRVAPSFIRFGNFEILAERREHDLLRKLAGHTIRRHFAELGEPSRDVYLEWLAEVVRRTARMVVEWMRVGFVHGVMNTDNMSVLGLTIDYGPYGWLDDFDPSWTPNTTDASQRRYRFGAQPRIALWNCVRFAESLYALIEDKKALESALDEYGATLEPAYKEMMSRKLGLSAMQDDDVELTDGLMEALTSAEIDMTLFYRSLVNVPLAPEDGRVGDRALFAAVESAYYNPDELQKHQRDTMTGWLRQYVKRVNHDSLSAEERAERMRAANPKYVLRNYIAQVAIDNAEQGNFKRVERLLEVMKHPYDEQPGNEDLAQKRPEWARHRAGCSMLSCSS